MISQELIDAIVAEIDNEVIVGGAGLSKIEEILDNLALYCFIRAEARKLRLGGQIGDAISWERSSDCLAKKLNQ